MRPKERRESGQTDLLRSRLDQILNMDHARVKLARSIDWRFLKQRLGAVYDDDPAADPADGGPGHPQVDAQPVRRSAVRALA